MKIQIRIISMLLFCSLSCKAQQNEMVNRANDFISSLDKNQKEQAVYSFNSSERYNWHFIPKDDRKGISLNEMNEKQRTAAKELMKTALSKEGYQKADAIMQLEKVLKVIENRSDTDHHRDPLKYYFTIFGSPSVKDIWGWRLEGHHISLNFSSDSNKLVSGTPGFFGSNPAIVLSGPEKGLEILKDEDKLAIELLHSLTKDQLEKAIIDSIAPNDIITYVSRKAMIENPKGISFSDFTTEQQKNFMQLLSAYIHRYTSSFANDMMKEIEAAGVEKLLFAWAGSKEDGPGHPKYYRIQGPTIIIEYDNTQNNGNHVHTVVRDLKKDFGGDLLLEHYKKNPHN
ncbi:MAG: DUF3500 domain-containing protein [Ginsengibacter sp.]